MLNVSILEYIVYRYVKSGKWKWLYKPIFSTRQKSVVQRNFQEEMTITNDSRGKSDRNYIFVAYDGLLLKMSLMSI